MRSFLLFVGASFPVLCASQGLTWPSQIDEFEDIMFLQTGYARRGLVDGVNPCSFASGSGRQASSEWVRTVFHDMITADVAAGTGGLDASLLYEMDRPENKGALSFNDTYGFLTSLFNVKVSMSDLTALGMYVAVNSCRGPNLQVRAGRVDATEAGPEGVPEPTDDTETMVAQFAKAGFNVTEMIASVACGHTLGGVRGSNFPEITGPGRQNESDFFGFDSTRTAFDNNVVTEYLADNTTNLLVVGPEVTNSDKRVFLADQNSTMQTLSSPETFSSMCKHVFERMLDTVPSSVTLSDPVTPYEVKPNSPSLVLTPGGQIQFAGSIRVRITERDSFDSMVVRLPYVDRDGNSCDNCTIETKAATFQGGIGGGFGEEFKFFEFNTSIPASSSISKFNVTILPTTNSSDSELHDNNGSGGFPLIDEVIFLPAQSCISESAFEGDENKRNLTVVVAVHDSRADKPVSLEVVEKQDVQGVIVPKLVKQTVQMEQWTATSTGYILFKATYGMPIVSLSTSFDIISGEGDDVVKDEFVKTGNILSKECQPWA